MKKFDVKKLLILLVIIALIAGAIFLITKSLSKDKLSKEVSKEVDTSISSFVKMTKGYSSTYGGVDVLFGYDKVEYKTLGLESVVYTAITYIEENKINHDLDEEKMNELSAKDYYKSFNNPTLYTGTSVRQAIKDLFGVDYENYPAGSMFFLYDINYFAEFDVYAVTRNDVIDSSISTAFVDYKITDTEKKDDKIIVTVAIIYGNTEGDDTTYYKDAAGKNVVAEKVTEKKFPEDKIDELDKYQFTLKLSDNKYVFESMEKVK